MGQLRKVLLIALLCTVACAGFFLLQNSIPDEITLVKGAEEPEQLELDVPFIEQEVIQAGSQNKSNIPEGAVKISCKFLGMIPIKDIQVNMVEDKSVIPCGMPIGIYMKTEGILVVGTGAVGGIDGLDYEPAANIIQSGDYIMEVDGKAVAEKEELIELVNQAGCRQIVLEVYRGGELTSLQLSPVQTGTDEYKLGIWVRDDTQGIGTLTYVDEDRNFGALGHGISDVDTGGLLSLSTGTLYHTDILSVTKGQRGIPGELAGVIRYKEEEVIGKITSNTNEGIFGTVNDKLVSLISGEPVKIAYKQEVEQGPASILCAVDGQVKEYQVEIEKVYLNSDDANKSMVIRVTDTNLLEKTGGIVQGMSGSPILQNGKLVGAVTHVFIQDSTSGFGIFIENMLAVD